MGARKPLATTHTSSPTCVCGSGRRRGLGTTCFARTPVPLRRGSDGSPAISMAMVRPFSHLSTRRSLRPSWTCRSVQIAPWRDGDERTSGGRAADMTLPGGRRGHVRRRDEKTKVYRGSDRLRYVRWARSGHLKLPQFQRVEYARFLTFCRRLSAVSIWTGYFVQIAWGPGGLPRSALRRCPRPWCHADGRDDPL